MLNAGGVYHDLQQLADYHDALRKYFAKFYSTIEHRFEDLSGIAIELEDHCSQGYFRANLCGWELEFRFTAHVGVDGMPLGVVTSYGKLHPDLKCPSQLAAFGFDRQGAIVGIEQPKDLPNILHVDNGVSAAFVFAECLKRALKQTPSAFLNVD